MAYFNYLEKSVERLEEFSYQALLITQLQSKVYKIESEEVNLLNKFTSALLEFKRDIDQKNILFPELHLLSKSDICTDAELLSNVLKICLNNAIKHAQVNDSIHIKLIQNTDYQPH